jgi:hypothetical protein
MTSGVSDTDFTVPLDDLVLTFFGADASAVTSRVLSAGDNSFMSSEFALTVKVTSAVLPV